MTGKAGTVLILETFFSHANSKFFAFEKIKLNHRKIERIRGQVNRLKPQKMLMRQLIRLFMLFISSFGLVLLNGLIRVNTSGNFDPVPIGKSLNSRKLFIQILHCIRSLLGIMTISI
jgi:hypothetical protein